MCLHFILEHITLRLKASEKAQICVLSRTSSSFVARVIAT